MRLRDALRRVPLTGWACAAIACLNAVGWSLVTPPFQVLDEPSHFAYVQELAETGKLPSSKEEAFSAEEEAALTDLHQGEVRYDPAAHPIFTRAAQRRLERDLATPLARASPDAGVANAEPPLYYALEALPYDLASGGTVLDRDALMRVLSALMAGCTGLFCFLFVREALPRVRWAWAVGGLGAALAPLVALMSGAVNPDALLYAVCAALFYLFARGFRRGLTRRLALAIGATLACGILTKLNFVGLLPGAALGVVVLTLRAARESRGRALGSLALASAVAASPLCLYVLYNLASGRAATGSLASGINLTLKRGSLLGELSYLWQFYLPRLPGMHDYFAGLWTTKQLWFNGFVGLYGWLDTEFPRWVYEAALLPAGVVAALLVRAFAVERAAVRRRVGELAVYATLTLGVMVLVGADDYAHSPTNTTEYAQARYLLPMLALYSAALALAARGAGRRWGPLVGASIVVVLLAHDLFSELLEISRYYG